MTVAIAEDQRVSIDRHSSSSRPVARWEIIALIVVVCGVLITRASTLDNKLLEAHASRQTQTAFQTVGFFADGIDLLHPTVPVLGAPWQIPFEFPAFQAAASVLMSWGMPADAANRSTALFFFIVTTVLLWILVRMLSNSWVALLAVVAFAFSPFAMLWSRASLMEYLATAASLGWVLSALRLRMRPNWWWAVGGAALGALAMSVKASSAILWLGLILLYEPSREPPLQPRIREWIRVRTRPPFLFLLLVPALLSGLWIQHIDSIKGASAATSWAVSSRWRSGAFGTLGDRLNPEMVGVVLGRIEDFLIGPGTLILLVAAVLLVTHHRRSWIGILLVPILAIGVFFNLYRVHDYYLVAVSPALAALVGLGIWSLVSWARLRGRLVPVALVVITGVWLATTLWLSHPYWSAAYAPPQGPPAASVEIAANTAPGDLLFVGGFNYDPRILYYAERSGLMFYESEVSRDFVSRQPDLDDYRVAYFPSPIHHLVDWVAVRPWYSPRTEHILTLGSSPEELKEEELLASTDPRPDVFDELPAREVIASRTELTCDGQDHLVIPSGPGEAWLSVFSEGQGRATMRGGLIAVPAETLTLVWKPSGGALIRGEEVLTCINGGILHVRVGVEVPVDSVEAVTGDERG